MARIHVEGWRFLSHSYSIVNCWQLLELAQRPEISLSCSEMPYPSRAPARLGWGEAEAARLRAIAGPDGAPADAVIRVFSPPDFSAASARRTAVFAVTEWGRIGEWGRIAPGARQAPPLGEGVSVFTPSRWSMEGLVRDGVAPERIAVVPHGVDTGRFAPAAPETRAQLRRRFGWEDRLVFLNVGSLSLRKGIPRLLKAFARFAGHEPRALLVLKGPGHARQGAEWLRGVQQRAFSAAELERLERQCRLLEASLTLGELAALYQAADAYVAPYLAEGFNLPVLEAVASGLPVICSAGGPTDEFTAPAFARRIESRRRTAMAGGLERRFLEPDLEHLLELMQSVARDEQWRAAARESGPAFARAAWTWRHAVQRLLAELERVP
jgi:glycosyltransferase involved in cell wall biosynthesis